MRFTSIALIMPLPGLPVVRMHVRFHKCGPALRGVRITPVIAICVLFQFAQLLSGKYLKALVACLLSGESLNGASFFLFALTFQKLKSLRDLYAKRTLFGAGLQVVATRLTGCRLEPGFFFSIG